MEKTTCKALIIEDYEDHAIILKAFLAHSASIACDVVHVKSLSKAIEKVLADSFDIVLLDLMLPDSRGLDTFTRFQEKATDIPIIVITAIKDESFGIQAVQAGAQDFLVKGNINSERLTQAIHYAILRHQEDQRLRKLAMVDDLSQVFNRRGFVSLFQHHTKLALRENKQLLLLMLDLDRLKDINDTFGHLEGDRAIIDTAKILKNTFRKSDLVARIGGDEFAVLAIQASDENEASIRERLEEQVRKYNATNPNFALSLSVGITPVKPDQDFALEELINLADKDLYEEKRRKRER